METLLNEELIQDIKTVITDLPSNATNTDIYNAVLDTIKEFKSTFRMLVDTNISIRLTTEITKKKQQICKIKEEILSKSLELSMLKNNIGVSYDEYVDVTNQIQESDS